jgi:hypothetical protein
MPWTASDAVTHTHKATTSELKELWAKVADECLEKTGDEGRAIREANAVIARQAERNYTSEMDGTNGRTAQWNLMEVGHQAVGLALPPHWVRAVTGRRVRAHVRSPPGGRRRQPQPWRILIPVSRCGREGRRHHRLITFR